MPGGARSTRRRAGSGSTLTRWRRGTVDASLRRRSGCGAYVVGLSLLAGRELRAKLAHRGRAPLEQLQLSLGHAGACFGADDRTVFGVGAGSGGCAVGVAVVTTLNANPHVRTMEGEAVPCPQLGALTMSDNRVSVRLTPVELTGPCRRR